MKKLLLLLMATGLVISVSAQSAFQQQQERMSFPLKKGLKPIKDVSPAFTGEPANEYVANRDIDIVIGDTEYDLQSNASLDHRIYLFDDGTMAAVWTRGWETGAYPDRGTGYNYHDGSDWGPIPTERIEPERTGWPSIAPYGENGEIVCAHTAADGLIFSWRETKGTGEWNNFMLYGPASTGGLTWPRMVTTGENHDVIHVISALFTEVYEDVDSPILYSRSADGGQTWDPENVILEGLGSDYTSEWGGDTYAWAEPQGDVIAFAAQAEGGDGVVMKSIDGGDNWERITYYYCPDPFFETVTPLYGCGDGYQVPLIDEDNKVHVAFGRFLIEADGIGGFTYVTNTDGLIYWNEDMAALDSAAIGHDNDLTLLEDAGYLAARVQEHGEDTLIDIATYQSSMTSMPAMALVDGQIYLFYSGIALGFDNDEFNYRHIWYVVSEDGGTTWSTPEDLTSDVFHLDKECSFTTVTSTATDKLHVLYQTSQIPGIFQRYESAIVAPHNMVYLPVNLHVGINDNYVNESFEVSQNYPNPVNGQTYFTVTLNQGTDLNLQVYTLTGQMVNTSDYGYKTAGTHTLTINANDMASGVYFYTVSTGTNKVTRKMIVQ